MKHLFLFLLVTAAAYAFSTLLLSYLDHELGRDLPCPLPESLPWKTKPPPPSSPSDSPNPS